MIQRRLRRTFLGCAAGALALFVVLTPAIPQAQGRGGSMAQSGQQGGLPALELRVQALEKAIADLGGSLNALGVDLRGQIDALSGELAGLRGQVGAVAIDMTSLTARVAELEDAVAGLGGGLTSYDQLDGLPCTTAVGDAAVVKLTGFLKTPVCAAAISANGRFFDLGPVIVDDYTHLMWEKKTTGGASLHHVDNRYNWCEATGNSTLELCVGNTTSWIGQVNAEVFAGFSDWRVPSVSELQTIVDLVAGPPHVDPIFAPTLVSYYWSSAATSLDDAMTVYFGNGSPAALSRIDPMHVRAVRTGS